MSATRESASKSGWGALPPPDKGRVIELLLRAGVDPRLKDDRGRTARIFLEDCPSRKRLASLSEADRRPEPWPAQHRELEIRDT